MPIFPKKMGNYQIKNGKNLNKIKLFSKNPHPALDDVKKCQSFEHIAKGFNTFPLSRSTSIIEQANKLSIGHQTEPINGSEMTMYL